MVVLGIVLFAFLILVHEFGHFITARRNGVEVEEFGIGFPPKLISKKVGKTVYSLNLFPLGGFVKLKGENDADKRKGSFGAASFWRKAKIIMAGVGMNIATAYFLLIILALIGLPRLLDHQYSIKQDERTTINHVLIAAVSNGTAAAKAGLLVGDRVVTINDENMTSAEQLTNYIRERPEQTLAVKLKRDNKPLEQLITLGRNEDGKGVLGVTPYTDVQTRYTWSAPIVAFGLTIQFMWLTLVGFLRLVGGLMVDGISSGAAEGAVGPVGLFMLLQNIGQFGALYLLLLIVTISVSLAVINALPIPALDGGRLAVLSLARVFRKPLSPQLENAIHSIGFIVLLGLIFVISYLDVKRFF